MLVRSKQVSTSDLFKSLNNLSLNSECKTHLTALNAYIRVEFDSDSTTPTVVVREKGTNSLVATADQFLKLAIVRKFVGELRKKHEGAKAITHKAIIIAKLMANHENLPAHMLEANINKFNTLNGQLKVVVSNLEKISRLEPSAYKDYLESNGRKFAGQFYEELELCVATETVDNEAFKERCFDFGISSWFQKKITSPDMFPAQGSLDAIDIVFPKTFTKGLQLTTKELCTDAFLDKQGAIICDAAVSRIVCQSFLVDLATPYHTDTVSDEYEKIFSNHPWTIFHKDIERTITLRKGNKSVPSAPIRNPDSKESNNPKGKSTPVIASSLAVSKALFKLSLTKLDFFLVATLNGCIYSDKAVEIFWSKICPTMSNWPTLGTNIWDRISDNDDDSQDAFKSFCDLQNLNHNKLLISILLTSIGFPSNHKSDEITNLAGRLGTQLVCGTLTAPAVGPYDRFKDLNVMNTITALQVTTAKDFAKLNPKKVKKNKAGGLHTAPSPEALRVLQDIKETAGDAVSNEVREWLTSQFIGGSNALITHAARLVYGDITSPQNVDLLEDNNNDSSDEDSDTGEPAWGDR